MQDWTGNNQAVFAVMGASNYSNGIREENDYYATQPKAVEELLKLETFNKRILEPCCGEGHIAKVLNTHGYEVLATDLIDRGYGIGGIDFFELKEKWNGDIITNPPYKECLKWTYKALDLLEDGRKLAMFLKIQFLETKARRKLFEEHPPKYVYVASSRLNCAKNGDFEKYPSSAVCYCWVIWEKGYKGETTLRWFN